MQGGRAQTVADKCQQTAAAAHVKCNFLQPFFLMSSKLLMHLPSASLFEYVLLGGQDTAAALIPCYNLRIIAFL